MSLAPSRYVNDVSLNSYLSMLTSKRTTVAVSSFAAFINQRGAAPMNKSSSHDDLNSISLIFLLLHSYEAV
eukprot:IDg20226t1